MRHAAQRREVQRVAVQPGRHLAALEQGGHVVADAGGKIAHRIAQARRVFDQHDRIFRQVVQQRRHLGVDERQVFVRRGQAAGLFQPLGVALDVGGEVLVLFAAGGQRAAHRPSKPVHAAGREVGQGLHARQAAQRVHLLEAALAAHVKGRDRVHLVVPELDAVGVLGLRWEHVQNTAAYRELARALDLNAALIARAGELPGESFERCLLARGNGHHRALERRGRQRALRRGLHGCDRESGLRQRVQCGEPPLLVAARHADHVHHDRIARGDLQHGLFRKALQIRGKTRRRAVVVSQHEHRAAGIQPERRRKVRLVDGRQADGERRRPARKQGFFQLFVFF